MISNQIAGWIAAAITVLGLIFGAGQKLGEINQRLSALERADDYYHGASQQRGANRPFDPTVQRESK